MKSISPLKNVLKKGAYGDYEAKNDEELIKIKEITKGKAKRFKGILGRRKDKKKAYVVLADGNTIDVTTGL